NFSPAGARWHLANPITSLGYRDGWIGMPHGNVCLLVRELGELRGLRWLGEQADRDKCDQGSEESGEDGIAISEDVRKEALHRRTIPRQGDHCAACDGRNCSPG